MSWINDVATMCLKYAIVFSICGEPPLNTGV